jgi:hypothetical protein
MMQTAQPWHRHELAAYGGLAQCSATARSLLAQRKMRPVAVVVVDVFRHQSLQMPFVKNDHVIEKISATAANPTLCNTVLSRTPKARSLELDTEALHCVGHFVAELWPSIKDQVAGSRFVREGFA